MPLILRIKLGPLEGKSFKFSDGDIIGRGADMPISIPDVKISTKHAQISRDQQGEFVINDLGSTNGLRLKGKKVAQVTLQPGVELLLGNTLLECVMESDTIPKDSVSTKAKSQSVPVETQNSKTKEVQFTKFTAQSTSSKASPALSDDMATAPIAVELVPQTWNEYLADFTRQKSKNLKTTHVELKPFAPPLVLTFIRGPQIGTEWTFGYGPRNISPDSFDYRVLNTTGPEPVFQLTPKGQLALIQTGMSDIVKLNGKPLSSDVLNEGDIIIAGEAHLRVGYRE
jgi:pSer/pThr/pTyr-binding forkhead associated (FHA) protein